MTCPVRAHPGHRSPSSLCKAKRCLRCYFFSRVMGLERDSVPRMLGARMGSALHAAAPFTHAKARNPDQAFHAFDSVWLDGDDYADKKRTRKVGNRIIGEMTRVHGLECVYEPLTPVELGLSLPGNGLNEAEFTVDLGLTSGKPMMGIVDSIVRVKSTGELGVVDYKSSTSIWSSTFGAMFALSPQVYLYVMSLRVMGLDIRTAFIEGILVAATKCEITLVPLEIIEDVADAMLEWVKDVDEAVMMCEQAPNSLTDPYAWPQNFAGCNPYPCFGTSGFECEFDPLCSAGRNWEELLSLYVVKPPREKKEKRV